VLHTTAGFAEGTADWFEDPASGVSAHYLVCLDGRILQFVDETDSAAHVGRGRGPRDAGNLSTIGIEFEDKRDPFGVERSAEQYWAGAHLLAEIAQRWQISLDSTGVIPHRELREVKGCPGNLDIERLLAHANRPRPRLIFLLPVRNGGRDLPDYLTLASTVADGIVALDDGSTDETSEILAASPLVRVHLHNAPRPDYGGWDDAANRNRLLSAAAEADPDWLLSLDVDERLPPEDGHALRRFLASDALPGLAYGFRHLRRWGAEYDSKVEWIYRLFAYRPRQRFPKQRLHFNPIPTDIERRRWMRTTLRIDHVGAADEERRRARLRKYREADPGCEYPLDYAGLDRAPARTEPLKPRSADLPVLLTPRRARRKQ
jgi:hypothetical protein